MQEREKYLYSHIKEFYKLYLFNRNKIKVPDNISLIQNYNDYIKNKDNKELYILLNKTKMNEILIRKDRKIEVMSNFMYKSKSYLYFHECKEIFGIQEKLYFWALSEYSKKGVIEVIKYYIDRYKEENNIQKFMNLQYNEFNQFLLINKDWIDYKLKNDTNDAKKVPPPLIERNTIQFNNYKYPKNFCFIEKEKDNIIRVLLEKDNEETKIDTLFFVNDNNYCSIKNKNMYIGLLDDNVIYFYLLTKEQYLFNF